MAEYGTIKIPREKYDTHNEHRRNLGVTWEEYLDGHAPDHPDPVDYGEVEARARKAVEDVLSEEIPSYDR